MKRFGLLLIGLGLVISVLLWNRGGLGKASASASSSDETIVLKLSESLMSGERTVMFKYGASIDEWPGNSGSRFGLQLCNALQMTVSGNSADSNLACSSHGDHGSAQLKLTKLADNSAYLFVLLKTTGTAETIQSLVENRQAADETLHGLGIQGAWNTIVSGALAGSAEAVGDRIESQVGAAEVERYSDEGTTIYAYQSPELHTHIASGKEQINLQAALRYHSESGKWLITLGTPVITGEIFEFGE